jgi:glycosyltransferase involved in cell wall biosynthesis
MVVVPSVWADPCPTVALEAMAWGTPVVGSALGGLTDIVDNGVTGLLVPPGDAGALAGAITRLVAEPALREEMGRRSRNRVSLFSTDAVIPKLEAIYASTCDA